MKVRIVADVKYEFEVEADNSDLAEAKVRKEIESLELENVTDYDYQIVSVQEL